MIIATITGNVGNAELKTVGQGKPVLNFSVASNNPRKKDDPPTWVRCAIWGERAQKLAQYIQKGTTLSAGGVLTTRVHDGKTYIEMDVADVKLVGGQPKTADDDGGIPF